MSKRNLHGGVLGKGDIKQKIASNTQIGINLEILEKNKKNIPIKFGKVTDDHTKLEPLKCNVGVKCDDGKKIKQIINNKLSEYDQEFKTKVQNLLSGTSSITEIKTGFDQAFVERTTAIDNGIDIPEGIKCKVNVQTTLTGSTAEVFGYITKIKVVEGQFIVVYDYTNLGDVTLEIIKAGKQSKTAAVLFSDLCIGSNNSYFGDSGNCASTMNQK